MRIIDKRRFKEKLREEIIKYIKSFPVFFWGNILVNIFLVMLVALAIGMVFLGFSTDPELILYSVIFMAFLFKIMEITFRDLKKNMRILTAIQTDHYDNEIEEYELDNVIQFIEELPRKKEEIEKIKVALSNDKLINILELIGLISCEDDIYDIDVRLKSKLLIENIVE